jgi:DNA (cytosine-5)-methyltransferase 1
MQINLLDLFSGIGGFHLGLERAGFKVNAYNSEIDKYAIDVYKQNFKNSTYVGSVTDVRAEQLPRIDAITFGSPCQDFSLAGKRRGMGGQRSSLITEAIRLIGECRPHFFIWENVKGTFSSNNGADFWAIIQAFTNIGGYRLEWQLLNTKWFLPQNRERIYLVGYLGNTSGGQVFPIGGKDSGTDERTEQTATVRTLTAGGHSGGLHSSMTLLKVSSATKKGYEIAREGDSINLSLDTHCNQAVIYDGYNNQIKDEQVTGTITQHCSREGMTNGFKVIRENKIRRLTPIECERLQGFPDNWTKYGTQGEISDSQRYKMCGNAVTVDVVKAVAEKIKKINYATT